MPKFKVDIQARWSSKIIFSAEIEADADASEGVKRGMAVKAALASGSNLSGSDLRGSDLSGSNLRGSNLRGSDLRDSDLRGSNLRGSDLRDSDLRDSDLSGSNLRGSDLRGSDLSGSNLRGSNLRGSNLSGSDLRDSDLSGSNLSGSNLSGFAKVENLDASILAALEAGGTLDMGSWHTCETTHCRAGWAVHLAGPVGLALEYFLGTNAAAALIYAASTPDARTPNFYATNEEAMEDMRERAGFAKAEGAA